jgi:hypothetical protein
MTYYAYSPDKDNKEPVGSDNRILCDYKHPTYAIRKCHRFFTSSFRLYSYTDFYDESPFKLIYEYAKIFRN